uniref:Uncharacterized protein n=1 Tax=Anopheles culicifacies TaxID=139723 RepID=A0A182M871_9DIPT
MRPTGAVHPNRTAFYLDELCISVESNRTKSTFDFFTTVVLLHGARPVTAAGELPSSCSPSAMVATVDGKVSTASDGLMVLTRDFRDTRSLDDRWRVSLVPADDSEMADGEEGMTPATGGSGDEGMERMRNDTFFALLPLKCVGCPSWSDGMGSFSNESSIPVLLIWLCHLTALMVSFRNYSFYCS